MPQSQPQDGAPEVADIVAVEIRGIEPVVLPLLEPRCIRLKREAPQAAEKPSDSEETCRKRIISVEVGRLLNTCASIFSAWYLELQDVIARGRVYQEKYREEHKLHKNSKAPWKFPGTTEMNTTVVEAMQMAVRTLFCDEMANYAMDCYERAIMTGDKRAFKIRLMFLKCRDFMKGHPLHDGFAAGVEEAVTLAEAMAGCIPYGGPRRMSRAERAAKEKRDLEKASSSSPDEDEKAETDADILADVLGENGVEEVLPCEEDAKEPDEPIEEHEKPPEPSEFIDDDLLSAEVAAGTMTPGKALLLMMKYPAAPSKPAKIKPSRTKALDMDKLADEVLAMEGAAEDQEGHDDEDLPEDADDDDIDEDEGDSQPSDGEEEDDDEEEDEKPKRRRRRSYLDIDFSYVGRERYRRDYGAYNQSGSEWDPNAE